MNCKYCKQDAMRLLSFAILKDLGARGHDPLFCAEADDNQHDFSCVKEGEPKP